VTGDPEPRAAAVGTAAYASTANPVTLRTRDQILALFGGLQILEPGLVPIPQWRPDEADPVDPAKAWILGGVARKPLHAIEERLVAVLAARIDQGRRTGDVRPGIDPRATAEFLLNTSAGLRILAKTNEAPALYRIIEVALTTLWPASRADGSPHALFLTCCSRKGIS
jgi:hypothetical protein